VIVGAGLIAHTPIIMLPEAVRLQLNDGVDYTLPAGLRRLRSEVLDELQPETIVVIDTHWFTTVEFVVAAHAHRSGRYTSEELPRGVCQVPYDFEGDPELARALAAAADARDDAWITAIDDPYLPIHYPTVNLLSYLHQPGERWMSISVCQTGELDDFLLVGELLREAVNATGRRTVVLASGGMSHRFWPLRQQRAHEGADPSHVFSPQAREADLAILQHLAAGQHAAVIDSYPDYSLHKPEGRFGHYLTMVGALGGRACVAKGRQYSEYENSAGTGQVHMWFDLN
jgi:3,4-dihydroxyphenylacetate 2,3-dioxygenase